MSTHGSDKTATTRRVVGKPFEKGQSGNPGGRPSYPDWFRTTLTEDSMRFLAQVARGEAEDPKVSRAQACQDVLDRIMGTAPKSSEDVKQMNEMAVALLAVAASRVKKDGDGE